MSYLPPTPSYAMKGQIHTFAEIVAVQVGFTPSGSLDQVVAKLGGLISYRDAVDEENPDSIIVEPDGTFEIFLTSLTSVKRDRFTIAHELGHYFVHYPIVARDNPGSGMEASRWIDPEDPTQQRAEWEANWFAGAFLMPEATFLKVWQETENLSAVASYFEVSKKAAEVRARTIGVVV